ncbi:hypothetical protein QDX25_05215 [Auritidibacter ignavus]|uniref:Uncharacterized protein n=2 Tax=Auritidibacter ignavus TaxID=678932 RepID=A0AAJ6AQA6_9MICC|nr:MULTISPECIES: hypothetical protein [Auritidibacter]AXR73856.1 hypothetical protein DCC27_005575 [Auritidibacter sp. NML130574]PXA78896.1 hypothetical protein DCC25_10690 [Auritidibacter sp. NML120636]WGH82553.1 hypothetical protein QDX25_05215 [Auritidibacter ignavus]WGH91746.1 hypothetical protein QDX23_05145 [Auritidibacter ignavus]WGH94195.1 hypothetical protein QDX21_05225 [Auritidibacter ignavus]
MRYRPQLYVVRGFPYEWKDQRFITDTDRYHKEVITMGPFIALVILGAITLFALLGTRPISTLLTLLQLGLFFLAGFTIIYSTGAEYPAWGHAVLYSAGWILITACRSGLIGALMRDR